MRTFNISKAMSAIRQLIEGRDYVSPNLNAPLRTIEQAKADMAKARGEKI